jgi:hypothetical protein
LVAPLPSFVRYSHKLWQVVDSMSPYLGNSVTLLTSSCSIGFTFTTFRKH